MREAILEPAFEAAEFETLRDETIDDIVSIADDDGGLCGVFLAPRTLWGPPSGANALRRDSRAPKFEP